MSAIRKAARVGIFANRIFATLFGLAFFAAGCFFTFLVVSETWEIYQARQWEEVPCVITGSNSEVIEDGYEFRVSYSYHYNGRTWTAYDYTGGDGGVFSRISEVDALIDQHRPGKETVCFVNPESPGRAVLKHQSLARGFMALFTMIFIVVGAAVIYGAWSKPGEQEEERSQTRATSGEWGGRLMLAGFFSIFFFAGSAIGYFFIFPAIINSLTSGDWMETPCTIHSSRVKVHEDSDGDTYSVDIMYSYTFDGKKHRSNRYGFMRGSSSGHAGKAEIVRQYPPGASSICYVNPDDPGESVLSRSLGAEVLLVLFPLVFMGVGGGGMAYALFFSSGKRKKYSRTRRPLKNGLEQGSGVKEFKPGGRPVARVLGALFAALFWNGIVSAFLFGTVEGWKNGNGSIGATLFLVPFVIIGLLIIFGFFSNVIAVFNPRFLFTLHSDYVCLGDEVRLHWLVRGNPQKIKRFTINLLGIENATYRRGTSTLTDANVFFEKNVADLADPGMMKEGEVRLPIPRESMHSFKSSNNAIIWKLQVRGDIPWRPDVKEDYELDINPLPQGEY